MESNLNKFITVKIAKQEFGILIPQVNNIIFPQEIYSLPLVRKEVMGVINLRGKIVTVLDIKLILGVENALGKPSKMIISESMEELFGFGVDEIGEVNSFDEVDLIKNLENFSPTWQAISLGIYPKEKELIMILDINKIVERIFSQDGMSG
jgi:purine-binding chemotaxis protein CheW